MLIPRTFSLSSSALENVPDYLTEVGLSFCFVLGWTFLYYCVALLCSWKVCYSFLMPISQEKLKEHCVHCYMLLKKSWNSIKIFSVLIMIILYYRLIVFSILSAFGNRKKSWKSIEFLLSCKYMYICLCK